MNSSGLDSRLETLGSAAAGIAHDINNQLNLIVNYIAASDIAGALCAVERCSAITASLLSYCKGDSLQLSSIAPHAFLRSFETRLRLPERVALVLRAESLLPPIVADPVALTRVLTNLVSNACDAMKDVGALRLTASPLAIELSDSGPGVPAALRQRIFEPFFTTRATGTGLGLSIVRELMRQQGGSVFLGSEPGRGAQFILRFRAG